MTTASKTTNSKKPLNKVVAATAEQLEKATVEAKEQALESIGQSKEKLEVEAKQLSDTVQEQLRQFRQDVLQRVDSIKEQWFGSQKELKNFIKIEFTAVLEDLYSLGKEFKQDVTQISSKHKELLTGTLKRSKDSTIEVLKKVKLVVKENKIAEPAQPELKIEESDKKSGLGS